MDKVFFSGDGLKKKGNESCRLNKYYRLSTYILRRHNYLLFLLYLCFFVIAVVQQIG